MASRAGGGKRKSTEEIAVGARMRRCGRGFPAGTTMLDAGWEIFFVGIACELCREGIGENRECGAFYGQVRRLRAVKNDW
jgi:hypothetical protein